MVFEASDGQRHYARFPAPSPSCRSRRMNHTAAHLVDSVPPQTFSHSSVAESKPRSPEVARPTTSREAHDSSSGGQSLHDPWLLEQGTFGEMNGGTPCIIHPYVLISCLSR